MISPKLTPNMSVQKSFPYRESNPGLLGESQISQPLDHVGQCFRPGSNRRPSACQADVITATPRKLLYYACLSRIKTICFFDLQRMFNTRLNTHQISLAVIVQWLGPCVVAAVTQVRILVTAVTFLSNVIVWCNSISICYILLQKNAWSPLHNQRQWYSGEHSCLPSS